MPEITQTLVNGLKPTGKQMIVHDEKLSGFRVIVRANGKVVFGIRYRVGGGRAVKPREAIIGAHPAMKVAQARRLAADYLAKAGIGEDPMAARDAVRASDTFADICARYVAEHARKKKSGGEDARLIEKELTPRFGKMRIAEIGRKDVAELHASMSDRPVLANRARALLSKIFALCEVWELRPQGTNPCTLVEPYKERARERFLSDDELARLGDALRRAEAGELSSSVSPFVVLALRLIILTGARKGEVLGLRWNDVNFATGVARLPDSKTGAKSLYLGPAAIDLLRGAERMANNEFVCCGHHHGQPLKNISKSWSLIRSAAGLEDVTIHDLRHSFASVAVERGITLHVLGKLLGHRDPRMTDRYAHLAAGPLVGAAGDISAAIAAGLGDQEEKEDE